MDQNSDLKIKLQQLMDKLQAEVKKTAQIGVKMISASKTNTELNKYYEELGEFLYCSIKKGKVELEGPEIANLVKRIDDKITHLESLHQDMGEIKRCQADSKKDM